MCYIIFLTLICCIFVIYVTFLYCVYVMHKYISQHILHLFILVLHLTWQNASYDRQSHHTAVRNTFATKKKRFCSHYQVTNVQSFLQGFSIHRYLIFYIFSPLSKHQCVTFVNAWRKIRGHCDLGGGGGEVQNERIFSLCRSHPYFPLILFAVAVSGAAGPFSGCWTTVNPRLPAAGNSATPLCASFSALSSSRSRDRDYPKYRPSRNPPSAQVSVLCKRITRWRRILIAHFLRAQSDARMRRLRCESVYKAPPMKQLFMMKNVAALLKEIILLLDKLIYLHLWCSTKPLFLEYKIIQLN